MAQISVEEASQNLLSLLERVSAGEEILLQQQGRVVARLMPPESKHDWLADLKAFRMSLQPNAYSLSTAVIEARQEERY